MKVGVRLYAILRRYRPADLTEDVIELDLADRATARDAAQALGVPDKWIHAVFVNDQQATLDMTLGPGDLVRLFPPVAGGARLAKSPHHPCHCKLPSCVVIAQGGER